jgi:acetyltransferase-like isoleucine patch superfamily enzyme
MLRKIAVWGSSLFPSSLKILTYRALLGARIGHAVKIKLASVIMSEKIEIEDGVVIGSNVHIMCKEIRIGEESIICAEVRIDGEDSLSIGKNCYVGQRTHINATEPVTIEDGVGIGNDTSIFTHGVWVSYLEGLPRKFAPVKICRDSWVPPRCIVQPGVTIGPNAIIATGAVVTKDVPGEVFAGGIPAIVIRKIEDLKEPIDLPEKDRRTREMLHAFIDHVRASAGCLLVPQVSEEGVFFAPQKGSKKRYGIYYLTKQVSDKTLESLLLRRAELDSLAVVALRGFTVAASVLEGKGRFIEWFDLERFVRKRSWNRLSILLRDFLRGHYGVRFALEPESK